MPIYFHTQSISKHNRPRLRRKVMISLRHFLVSILYTRWIIKKPQGHLNFGIFLYLAKQIWHKSIQHASLNSNTNLNLRIKPQNEFFWFISRHIPENVRLIIPKMHFPVYTTTLFNSIRRIDHVIRNYEY